MPEKNPPYFFRSERAGRGWFVSGDSGPGLLLSGREYAAFSGGGRLPAPLRGRLAEAGLLRERLDMEGQLALLRARFLGGWSGPAVHIVSLTARCNCACRYCSASSPGAGRGRDMSAATARAVTDFIFASGAPRLLIEFQGGEPLLNFPALKALVERAGRLAAKGGREVRFSVVTNLSLMDAEKFSFLKANRVTVCTSLDGPADLHDANRVLKGGAHAAAARWLPRLARASARDPRFEAPNAICTVTRRSLGRGREIVDEFLRLGLKRVQLGPLDPLGLAAGGSLGCSPEEFAAFYLEALDYMLELSARGRQVHEKAAKAFAERVLTGRGPRYHNLDLAMRLAYNWDGSVYGSDEARMLANSGDEFFRLGSVRGDSFAELLGRPLARALLLSCFQGLAAPACARCPYEPYCRVSPVYNYAAQGSFWGDKMTNERCRLFKAVYGGLLSRMGKPAKRRELLRWAELDA